MIRFNGTQGYAEQAADNIARYESLAPDELHASVAHLIGEGPLRTLDIGAGSGRDAAWLAAKGHSVLCVEPTREMREAGMRLHPHPCIEWVEDGLPDLPALAGRGPFDLIMLTAVWMHLDEGERARAMPRLAALAAPGAVMTMMLRHGPVPFGRRMFQVTAAETIALAEAEGFELLLHVQRAALRHKIERDGVTWTSLAFRRV